MNVDVTGEVIEWRGPAPYHYVPVPDAESADIKAVAAQVTYGWGVIPVTARIGGTTWTTSLFPKDGRYLVPLKDAVRAAEGIQLGDVVTIRLTLGA
ncbi:MAG TPA: DUF1905 domain-containing protein [Mycobacteriales bacterium]|nr:DUF1905 domain-containing protein [Mycobacteriales bacterium]